MTTYHHVLTHCLLWAVGAFLISSDLIPLPAVPSVTLDTSTRLWFPKSVSNATAHALSTTSQACRMEERMQMEEGQGQPRDHLLQVREHM